MAGHSKWKNIAARKGKQDAIRGKIFTKLGRELSVAARMGGADPSSNATLAAAIAKAKANNMPNDTIKKAIAKAAGESGGANFEEIVYEGYGSNGIAIIVEVMTDNKNRTASEVRHLFSKHGGNLGTSGCVSYMFDKKGVIVIEKEGAPSEEELFEVVVENEAEDLKTYPDVYEVITEPGKFSGVLSALQEMNLPIVEANVAMVPQTTTALDANSYAKIEKLVELLEDNDDVQNVYHNAEELEV